MGKKGIVEKYQFLIIGIGIIAVIAWAASSGMLAGTFGFEGFDFSFPQAPLAPLDPGTEFLSYNVNVDIQPNPLCAGDDITATITSNIPNGVCSIFMDPGTGFFLLTNIYLDSSGNFTTTETITTIGTATFRTICCDAEGNCRIAGDTILTVTNTIPPCPPGPGPPPPPPPADSDGDGFTDEEEMAADTDPNDPNEYPGSTPPPTFTCGVYTTCLGTCPTVYECEEIESDTATWCACISEGTVHNDWKPGGVYYNPWN